MMIPDAFPYREVFLHGRPVHENDGFYDEHPRMERGKRAKIFAPFDALDGYGDAVRSKNVSYVAKITPSEEQSARLNRRLSLLHKAVELCSLRGECRPPMVRITYYVHCPDRHHEAWGRLGTYETVEGFCLSIDAEVTHTVRIGGKTIPIENIRDLRRITKNRPHK